MSASQVAAGTPTLHAVYDTRRNNLGFLRFVLATTVIWSHSYPLSGRPADPLWELTGQIDGGSLAVDGFFILSGFLVTQSWMQQPDLRAFALKRFLRIVPALLLATVFGAFLIAPLGSTLSFGAFLATPDPWLHFLGVPLNRFLFVSSSFLTNPHPTLLNSPLWSLRYEIGCYVALGLAGAACGRRLGPVGLAALAVATVTYALVPDTVTELATISKLPRLFACFSAGVVMYAYRDRIPVLPQYALAAGVILLVTGAFGGLRLMLPYAGAYLLMYVAISRTIRLHDFCRYGDFSYGLYIFACPIQQLVVYYLGTQLPVWWFFALAYAPTIVLAAASWHVVEAPALRLKPTAAR